MQKVRVVRGWRINGLVVVRADDEVVIGKIHLRSCRCCCCGRRVVLDVDVKLLLLLLDVQVDDLGRREVGRRMRKIDRLLRFPGKEVVVENIRKHRRIVAR